VQRGSVELPPSFFDRTGIEPGNHVAVDLGDIELRAVARLNEMLKGDEVRISPRLSVLLGVESGDVLCVKDRKTFGDRVFDKLESVTDLLEDGAGRLRDLLGMDIDGGNGLTVGDVLEGTVRRRTADGEEYLEVAPNAPGSMAVQVCDIDPSLETEVWDPDPAGRARLFRPGTSGNGK
jgi:hypothetical protein